MSHAAKCRSKFWFGLISIECHLIVWIPRKKMVSCLNSGGHHRLPFLLLKSVRKYYCWPEWKELGQQCTGSIFQQLLFYSISGKCVVFFFSRSREITTVIWPFITDRHHQLLPTWHFIITAAFVTVVFEIQLCDKHQIYHKTCLVTNNKSVFLLSPRLALLLILQSA